ncbi:hypothetical protein BH23GEM9_BH23GEM9_34040 [soil metagenome]
MHRTVGRAPLLIATVLCLIALPLLPATAPAQQTGPVPAGEPVPPMVGPVNARVPEPAALRLTRDLSALDVFRPGYPFWRHVFTVPDGAVAFGSGTDGRLLAVFPATADWTSAGRWHEPAYASILADGRLPLRLDARRDEVARLLEIAAAGPVLHNPTRGRFLMRNVPQYGAFLREWGEIYERFGVPAELGLAQAIVESGLNGTIRSEARAIGFCQWLEGNWNKLKRLAPHVIEANNQTTQAPYCAAYLAILATKYGSFVPALSEHHAGGTNVGRILINGERLGGEDVRARYFLGSQFAVSLRQLSPARYSDLYRTYGPRSFRYAELVFGNMATVAELRESTPQQQIHAMRTTRVIPLTEITRRTGLSDAEVKRYNPALVRQVPARATLYLPMRVAAFGSDVSFWQRPPTDAWADLLLEFLALDAPPDRWDEPSFEAVLRDYQRRFERTGTEEGRVMAVVLAYVADETRASRRGPILREFRDSHRIARLLDEAVSESLRASGPLGEDPAIGR